MNSSLLQRNGKHFPSSSHLIQRIDSELEVDSDIRSKNSSTFQERRKFSTNRTKKLSINIADSQSKNYKNSKFKNRKNISTAQEFYQNYEILEKIGEGGSSVVKQCREIKSGQLMVVKIIKYSDTERVFSIIQEEKILSGLDHPNIIKNHGFYIDTQKKTCYIIMEQAQGKSISQHIIDRYPFTNYKMSQLTKSLLQTLNYLHLNHICHRDITPDNVMYDLGSIKLIDFSISKDLGDCVINGKMYSQNGNIAFMAPEVLLGQEYDNSVDIWGVGITILSALLGYNPFVDENGYEMSTIKNICENELNYSEYTDIDQRAIDLLSQMLQKNPSKRITINQALKHEWLDQKIDKQELISPKSNQHKFQRHSIYLCNTTNFCLNKHSNKINFKRGSLLSIKYISKTICEGKEDIDPQSM